MPSIDMKGHSYDEFLSAIEHQGYYEIKNPRVYKPGTNETVKEFLELINGVTKCRHIN